MLDRTSQLDDGLCGGWSRLRLLEMNEQFCKVMEQAFERGLESRASATATVRVGKRRVTEEEAIETVWKWFVHCNEGVEDIAFVDVVARVRALLPNVTAARVRLGFETRFKRERSIPA
jgi:hypothetical protein